MFVENAVFEDNEDIQQEFFPLSLMDAWEIKPQDIIVLGQLGEGNFGEVFRGLLKSGIDTPSGVHEEVTHRGIVVAVKLLKCMYYKRTVHCCNFLLVFILMLHFILVILQLMLLLL